MTSQMPAAGCPFCKRIASGEFGAHSEDAVTFEPLNPVTPGHLLVVPRKHIADVGEDPWLAARTMRLAALMASRLDSANIITSLGGPATQTVFHAHLHVVPRHEGDGLHLPWTAALPALTRAAAEQRAAEALWKSGACEPQEAAALARIALSAALPELTGAITSQAAAAEREACALLADYYAEQIACHECGSEAAYSAASLIRSRSGLLGGAADGAHAPGGAT